MVIAVLEPRMQNADDQKRLDALAPYDEKNLTHQKPPAIAASTQKRNERTERTAARKAYFATITPCAVW